MLGRRMLIAALAGGLLFTPLAVLAQPAGKSHRVGVLSYLAPEQMQPFLRTLAQSLQAQGYVEGKNLTLVVRTTDGRLGALPDLAFELVKSEVDVILAIAPLSIRAAHQATSTIPIVMAIGDPAMFASLARPGGNITGVTALAAELAGKQVELIKEALPGASRIAVLRNPNQPVHVAKLQRAEASARALGVHLIVVDARTAEDFDAAFSVVEKERAEGLIVFADGVFRAARTRLVLTAARLRLPAVYASAGFAEAGGLIEYIPDFEETFQRAGSFIGRILKGAHPASLPVEQPSRFHLFVNRATAATLDLALPPALLLRANQIIE
jgi:putative tryptophan/tyrosine transport system substrate-binding protein